MGTENREESERNSEAIEVWGNEGRGQGEPGTARDREVGIVRGCEISLKNQSGVSSLVQTRNRRASRRPDGFTS